LAVQLADGDDPAAGGELLGDRLVIAGADAEARPQDDQGFLPIMAALSGGAWLGCGAVLGTCLGRSRRRVHRAFVAHWRWSEDAHGRGAAVRHLHVHPLAVHILDGNFVIFAHLSHDMCAPEHIWLYQDNAVGLGLELSRSTPHPTASLKKGSQSRYPPKIRPIILDSPHRTQY